MNRLAVKVIEENGKSFQLIVDGTPLSDLLNDGNDAIPYWIVEDDLPYFPPYGNSESDNIRIVTVCDCGEYGCGHSHCRVTKTDDTVIFDQFQCDTYKEPDSTCFVFSRSNYDEVVSLIVFETKKEKGRTMTST